jgi:hypothetical protein
MDESLHGRMRETLRPRESFLEEYKFRTRRYSKLITIYPSDLQQIGWSGKPIEFLLVDAMKSWNPGGSLSLSLRFSIAHFHVTWLILAGKAHRQFALEQNRDWRIVRENQIRIDAD